MSHPVLGLHHVTATANIAQADLDFYRGLLGLRLVKKTVNFDNHHVYHFYYGTEIGLPGTIWTTFPYAGHGVPPGAPGAGQIRTTSFSVPAGSLAAWTARLSAAGVAPRLGTSRFGEEAIECRDPSGLTVELVASDRDPRAPWNGAGIAAGESVRGLHSVTLVVRSAAATIDLMTRLLNASVVGEGPDRLRVAVGKDVPGHLVEIVSDAGARPARNGLGTVHHVAFAIDGADEQLRLRQELLQYGTQVTDVRDRQYFQSIYFREPGGVLFEVATTQPGFLVDEDRALLGQELKLPPWEEPERREIEAGLAPVVLR